MKLHFTLISILLLLSLSMAIFAAEDNVVTVSDQTLMGEDVILIEYDGGTITRKDLDNRISKIPPNQQGRFRTIDGQLQVLEVMALEDVMMKKAILMGIENDEEVSQKIDASTRQFYIQEYYRRLVSDKVMITEADKVAYFEENQELFLMLPVINISYIQVADEDAGYAALAELNSNIGWEEVSNLYSQNQYIKGLKGVIKNIRLNGNIPGIGTDKELEAFIEANLDKPKQIIGPVHTSTGWHLFRITEYKEGRQKSYEEVLPEIEQRLRPIVEKQILENLREQLIQKYDVSINDELIDQIDLAHLESNDSIRSLLAIDAPQAELQFTVDQLLASFELLSPQEQIFYIKGEGAQQMVAQELIRALMFHDAQMQNYEKYFEDSEDFNQMMRFYILGATYKKLVVESIEIPQEEIVAYYDSHISEYSTPASRSIQIFWGEDLDRTQASRKKFERMFKLGDELRMQQIIDEESKNPKQSVLDNQYNNGVVTGIGPDEAFSKMIWENPIEYLSPVFTTARGDIVFFRTTKENPSIIKSFTEMEPRIYGTLRKEKESGQQNKVRDELFEEFQLQKHTDRIRMKLSVEELFNMADDSARLRRFKDAINFYDQIITHYPNGSDDYKATFMKAFLVAEEMQNTDLAIDLFKAFLIKFPNGELNESAQFMIDTLEGNLELNIDVEDEMEPTEANR